MYTADPNGMADGVVSNDTLTLALSPALTGNYTIDPALPVSGTNFQDFASLASTLNTFGVCGPVSVTVSPGVYSESVLFGDISGTSSTNTITIDGGDSSATIIDGSAGFYSVAFDGSSYITLRNMGITNQVGNTQAVLFAPNATDNIVEHCEIKVPTTSTSSLVNPIGASASLTTRSTNASGVNNNTIQNNRIVGGYYGVYFNGGTGNLQTGNKVLNNDIDSAYYYGVYAYYTDQMQVSGNNMDLISRANVNADGFYGLYCSNGIFSENEIYAPDYGFYISNSSTVTGPTIRKTELINNMIVSDADYGVYLYSVDSVNLYHNTIVTYGTSTTSSPAIYIGISTTYPIDHYDVRNNIFYAENSEAFELVTAVDTIFKKFDNNIFYTGGPTTFRMTNTNYTDLGAYQLAAPSFNSASIQTQPLFFGTYDLHMLGTSANDVGDNSVNVMVDVDGDARPASGSTTVDIGADEFTPALCSPPLNSSFTNPSLDSVTIFWDGIGTSFQYEVTLAGAGQSGVLANHILVGSDSVRIGGLTASTQYEYYVREVCGRGDTSVWIGPIAFGTAIGVPYFQDFEGFANSNLGPNLDEGWTTVNSTHTWQTEDASGANENSTQTGPFYDNTTFGTPGGMYIYLETSSGTLGATSDLVSPQVYVDPSMNNVLLEFAYHMYGSDMGTLDVIVDTNGVETNVWSLSGQQHTAGSDPWSIGSANLIGFQGKSIKIIFRGSKGASYRGDMSIDDVSITTVSPVDAGVLAIASPQLPLCPGTVTPIVDVKNYGTDTISTVKVLWNVNGVLDSVTYSNKIAPGDTVPVSLGSLTINSTTIYDVAFYTKDPNNAVDGSAANDSVVVNGLRTGLSGSYTIDSSIPASASNWQSFTDFANDVSAYGLCGPMIVDVASKATPYNEQVELNNVQGASSTNTITINGHNQTLAFGSTNTNQRAVLTFNDASWITVDSLNIDATGSTYGWGIQNFGGAHHITITNCTIDAGAQNTSSFFAGIVNSGSRTSATSSGGSMHHITIDNCRIIGGYYGITSYGNTASADQHNFVITNNSIEDSYFYATYFLYTDTILIENNDLSRPTKTAVSTFYGLYSNTGCDNVVMNANAIHNTHGSATSLTGTTYPIYFSSDATAGNENYVTNNIIYDINSNGTVYAIYDLGADGTNYINNTVSLDHASATGGTTRGFYQSAASSNSSFVNNIISISRGGSGIKHGIYLNNTATGMTVDYNDVYLNSLGTGATSYGYFTSVQATLADWQTNTSFGANSHETDPKFNNLAGFDFKPSSGLINNVGLANAAVTTDYFGVTRAAIPDLGAIEFTPPASDNLGFVALAAPMVSTDSCYGATEDVIVTLINAGGTIIDFTSSNATLTVNVSGATTQTLTATLNTNAANGGSPLAIGSVVDVNLGTINMTASGAYNFDGLITMVTDTFPQNDTLVDVLNLLPTTGGTLSGLDTICSGDTVTITADNSVGSLQWQVLVGGVWTDITGADSASIDVDPTTLTDYRALACGTVPSDTISILPINVSAPMAIGDTTIPPACNVIDSVYATASSATVNPTFDWYDAATGGNKITTGGNYWVSADGDSLMYRDTPAPGMPAYDTVYVEEVSGGGAGGASLLITEYDAGSPDALEIQNVSSKPVNVTGWSVAVSDNYTNINTTNTIVQTLSGTMAPGQLMNWEDATGANYWGNNLFWNPGSGGWIVLIDNLGNVVDFVVWDWQATDIAAMSITVNGFTVTPGANWVGAGNTGTGAFSRVGTEDNDDISDFVLTPVNMGTTNPGLVLPFAGGGCVSSRVPAYLAIDCTVGLEDTELISGFSVSPNPSNGEFKLNLVSSKSEVLNLSVRDVAGKVVYKDILNVNGNFTTDLDFTTFAKGVYFLQVQSGENSRVEKLIIK